MKRISFDENEEKRMSNVLRMAFGSVMSEPAKAGTAPPPPLPSQPDGEAEGNLDHTLDEYERRVIMESVNKAKVRCGLLKEEDVSDAAPEPPRRESVNARYIPLPLDALCTDEIGVTERLLYLYILANCAMGKNNLSIRELSDALKVSKSCVSMAIAALRNAEWLTWEAPRSGKSRQNHYVPLKWLTEDNIPDFGELPNNGSYVNSGNSPKFGNSADSGDVPENGDYLKSGNMQKLGTYAESLVNAEFVDDIPNIGTTAKSGDIPNLGHISKYGEYPKIGDMQKYGNMPNAGNSEKSHAGTEFIGGTPKNWDMSFFDDMTKIGESRNLGDRRKIVDTTEYRQSLAQVLREVKNRDLRDLKDIKILKDLKDKKDKISDFVNNLCVTSVDNSLLPEYLMSIFRIAFPYQKTERLQVVRKLTERLQMGFAWYVVLFIVMKNSPYLSGQDGNGWKCTLTWALARENAEKIMELTYIKYGLKWTPERFIEYVCRSMEKGEY